MPSLNRTSYLLQVSVSIPHIGQAVNTNWWSMTILDSDQILGAVHNPTESQEDVC